MLFCFASRTIDRLALFEDTLIRISCIDNMITFYLHHHSPQHKNFMLPESNIHLTHS